MSEQLRLRVDYSITQLRKGEQLALALNPDGGYYLAVKRFEEFMEGVNMQLPS